MKINYLIAPVMISILILTNLSACQISSDHNIFVKTNTYEGVIFTAEKTEQAKIFGREPDGYWTPEKSHIVDLEAGIVGFLQENAGLFYRQPPVWERLPDYKRQYFGIIEDGNKVIYANYFCDGFGSDWQNQYSMGIDGGDCYFQVKYAVDQDHFYDISVNGEA